MNITIFFCFLFDLIKFRINLNGISKMGVEASFAADSGLRKIKLKNNASTRRSGICLLTLAT